MTTTFYRVQGGIFPKRSKKNLIVHDNQIDCDSKFLYISDMQHMAYFFKKRLDFKSLDKLGEKN